MCLCFSTAFPFIKCLLNRKDLLIYQSFYSSFFYHLLNHCYASQLTVSNTTMLRYVTNIVIVLKMLVTQSLILMMVCSIRWNLAVLLVTPIVLMNVYFRKQTMETYITVVAMTIFVTTDLGRLTQLILH